MLSNIEKAAVLRKTATSIKEGCFIWDFMDVCTCGHLLKVLESILKEEIHAKLDISRREYFFKHNKAIFSYTALVNLYSEPTCAVTNLPFTEVLDRIILLGFTMQELKDLEYCSDTTILERMGLSFEHGRYTQKDFVIEYLNTWADMLEEQLEEVSNPDKILVSV